MHLSRHRSTRGVRKTVWALLSCALILVVIAAAGAWFSDAAVARAAVAALRQQSGVAPASSGADMAAPRGISKIGDLVWHDTDGDGTQAGPPSEPGIDGVVIRLYRQINTTWVLEQETVTGDDPSTPEIETGWYGFDIGAIFGDRYQVSVDSVNFQAGGALYRYMLTSANTYGPNPYVFEIDSSGIYQNFDIDFGYARSALQLVKVAGNAPDGGILTIPAEGAAVTYTYRVTNTGEMYLSSIVITDDHSAVNPICTLAKPPAAPLAPGASAQCTWTTS